MKKKLEVMHSVADNLECLQKLLQSEMIEQLNDAQATEILLKLKDMHEKMNLSFSALADIMERKSNSPN